MVLLCIFEGQLGTWFALDFSSNAMLDQDIPTVPISYFLINDHKVLK